MADFHIDPANGSDLADGTAWSSAWATWISGATAARITAGDRIKIAKSPDPTPVGDATWGAGPVPATKNITSSTNQTPITVTVSAHGYSTGDVVYVTGHTTNTNANGAWIINVNDTTNFSLLDSSGTAAGGAAGTVRKWNQGCIRLAGRVTDDIDNCDRLWTAVDAGCTPAIIATNGNFKDGTAASSFALAVGALTGLQAYHALPAALNLSGYQQVSFWAKSTVTLADGDLQLMLCSDAAGVTGDATINVPAMTANSQYQVCVVNKYANLPSSVASVALYQAVDKGALTFYLDNIIACKASSDASSLSLASLVSSDATAHGGSDGWWGLQSIKSGNAGSILMLDNRTTWGPSQIAGECYGGTSHTGTLYKRDSFATPVATSTAPSINATTEAGTATALITYSGGWDTTSNTQTGCTYYDGRSGWGQTQISHGYTRCERVGFARYYYGYRISAQYHDATGMGSICCCERGIQAESVGMMYDGLSITQTQIGVLMDSYYWFRKLRLMACDAHVTMGIYTTVTAGQHPMMYDIARLGGNVYGIGGGSGANAESYTLRECTMRGNYNSSLSVGYGAVVSAVNCSASDTWAVANNHDSRIYSQRHNGIDNNHYVLTDGGTITDQTTTVYGSAPAWAIAPTSARNSLYPLELKLARVPATAGQTISVTAHYQLSHATNIAAALVIEGGQDPGVPYDVRTDATASTAWQDLTVSATVSVAADLEVKAMAWYVAGNATTYVDNELSVTIT